MEQPILNGHYGKMLYCYMVSNNDGKGFSKGEVFTSIDEIKSNMHNVDKRYKNNGEYYK